MQINLAITQSSRLDYKNESTASLPILATVRGTIKLDFRRFSDMRVNYNGLGGESVQQRLIGPLSGVVCQ
jgi:hypothetical protein